MDSLLHISPSSFVFIFCLTALLGHVVNHWRANKSVYALPVSVCLVGAWGLVTGFPWAKWTLIVFTVWQVILPVLFMRRSMRAAQNGRFDQARRFAHLAAYSRSRVTIWRDTWETIHSLYSGDLQSAEHYATSLIASENPSADVCRQIVLLHLRQWTLLESAPLSDVRARALCETQRIDAAIDEIARLWGPKMGFRGLIRARNAMLPTLAFSGSTEAVKQLCTLNKLSAEQSDLWIAVSESASGHRKIAHERLERVSRSAENNPVIRSAAQYRLRNLPAVADVHEANRTFLQKVEQEISVAYHLRRDPIGTHWGLITMITVILGGFLAQWWLGGVESGEIAWRLGALIPNGRFPDEVWRLVAYGGLHFGWLHLITNLVVCVILGSIITRWLGSIGFISFFVLGVITAGVSISFAGAHGVTVGASGGTMALLGMVIGHIWSRRTIRTSRWGRLIGYALTALVGLETVVDIFVPMVSGAGHAGGLIFGLFAGVTPLSGQMIDAERFNQVNDMSG